MKILGLDLGPTSIGWALIETDDNFETNKILGLGSRIIPYSDDNIAADFSKGKGASMCAERTRYRQMRRNLDRFQLHREQLKNLLINIGIIDSNFKVTPRNPIEVWELRAKAVSSEEKLSLDQLASVLLHINHRRGYKHAKSDIGDSKQTDYIAKINNRYSEIKESGKTVGQFFYEKLKESEVISSNGKRYYTYRIKEEVCPRAAYEEEVSKILESQSEFYPDILSKENQNAIKQIIFYQRPLKSCKNLVSFCDFEKHEFFNKSGKKVDSGPKVAPRTSPIAQVCRLYEAINNIRLVNSRRKHKKADLQPSLFDDLQTSPKDYRKLLDEYIFTEKERARIFEYLNTHEKMTEKDLLKLLGLSSEDGFKSDKALGKGIQGNVTLCQIAKALEDMPHKQSLLEFNLSEYIPDSNPDVDIQTGEILPRITSDFINQPLYQLWHTLYSINDKDEVFKVLSEKFGINNPEIQNRLYALDFVKPGYANKSAKFMRKLIPLLKRGSVYSEACEFLGINHSNSLTKEEILNRELNHHLSPLHKGDLRQPVVEKILNQTINLVNAIIDEYGEIDEVRVELARELKRDKEGRVKMTEAISKNEKENKELSKEISELNILPTRRRIQKMKMLKETGNQCMYCGKTITPTRFIEGHGYDIEHIIPRSKLFDDSFTNKICACRECNASKGAQTAYDFMKSKGEDQFNSYLNRIEELYKANKISRGKRERLLMTESDIPDDFIERDLRETQYITKSAMKILSDAIRNVYASSGMVTDFFRHAWAYDTILHDINLPKYEDAGLTENVEYETHGQRHTAHRIKDWSKRKDHRHHALDALVVALTRQGYIQRLNTLNAVSKRDDLSEEWVGLDKWASGRPHINRDVIIKALDNLSVSFKSGKKVSTPGKRYIRKNGKRICVQKGICVPRGYLHKDSIYGRIKVDDGEKKIKDALENLNLISNREIRNQLEIRLKEHNGDIKKAIKDLNKNPVIIDGKPVETIRCFREESVLKYPIESIRHKDVPYIVDSNIRKIITERFEEVGLKDKDFVKSLAERPLYSDKNKTQKIRTIRLFTGLKMSTLVGVRKNDSGDTIGFAQTRNNHHVAFYRNSDGSIKESVVSFWDCVKRKNAKLPIIVKNPSAVWDMITSLEDNEEIEEIAKSLPAPDSEYIMSFQRNEMVVLGLSDDEWRDAVSSNDLKTINRHLYRVWKISQKQYYFKYHTNTTASIEEGDNEIRQHYILSNSSLIKLNPHKVTVSILGKLNLRSND